MCDMSSDNKLLFGLLPLRLGHVCIVDINVYQRISSTVSVCVCVCVYVYVRACARVRACVCNLNY